MKKYKTLELVALPRGFKFRPVGDVEHVAQVERDFAGTTSRDEDGVLEIVARGVALKRGETVELDEANACLMLGGATLRGCFECLEEAPEAPEVHADKPIDPEPMVEVEEAPEPPADRPKKKRGRPRKKAPASNPSVVEE